MTHKFEYWHDAKDLVNFKQRILPKNTYLTKLLKVFFYILGFMLNIKYGLE